MNLKNIVKDIKYSGYLDNREILNLAHDSRKVKKGTLFIAISGLTNDGHDYIFDAIDKGAIAIIANGRAPVTDKVPILQVKNPRKVMSKIAANFYSHPSKKANIIGVTGTNGKTTTTQLLDHILRCCNKNCGSLGTLGFSSPTGIVSTGFTTPESIDLQQILRTMINGGIQYIPMEISSHAIKMHRVDDIDLNLAVFTNLSIDHLDFHGTMEEYFQTKLMLFKKLNKDSTAILNRDDSYYDKIISSLNCNHLSFGFNKKSTLSVVSYKLNINYTKVTFNYKNKSYSIKTHLIGKFNLYNIMGAMLSSLHLGLNMNQIILAVESFKKVPGRLEQVPLNNNNYAIIDFAHSPDSFENVLSTIAEISNKKIITVFGCGGDRDKTKRPIMGSIAEKYSSAIYITNDNPRGEDEDSIIDDITAGFEKNIHVVIKNRENALNQVLDSVTNKIIVVLGKGQENYQIIGNEKKYHSDIDIIKKYKNEN